MTATKYLCEETNTNESDWEEVSGPETGVGIEHWFESVHDSSLVYVVDDQGDFTISFYCEED